MYRNKVVQKKPLLASSLAGMREKIFCISVPRDRRVLSKAHNSEMKPTMFSPTCFGNITMC